jgi:hypothetical protein
MRYLLAAAALFCSVGVTAGATSLTPPYMDDRSDAGALIRSYYNALVRKEFSRAWSYYGDDKPATDFDAFEDQSMDIDTVDLAFGAVFAEGAAGSLYYRVPVAVRVTREDGGQEQIAGCVLAKIVNPQVQGVPFRPMYIMSSPLEAATGALTDAVPADCPDG